MTGLALADPHQSGSFIISEANGCRSRDRVTLQGGSGGAGAIAFGTVLGMITATGKYVPSPLTGSDGSQIATAILWEDADASLDDVVAGVVARKAEVFVGALSFDPSVITLSDQQAKWAQLAAVGIIVREQDDPQARAANQLRLTLGW